MYSTHIHEDIIKFIFTMNVLNEYFLNVRSNYRDMIIDIFPQQCEKKRAECPVNPSPQNEKKSEVVLTLR